MKNKKLAFAIAAAFAASPVVAQEETEFNSAHDKTGFYVSPEAGIVKFADNCGNNSVDCEDTSLALGISGGYNLNEFFAVEGGFLFANGFESSGMFVDGTTFSVETEFLTWQLGGRGNFNISEQFSFTAQLGFHRWDFEDSDSDGDSDSFDGTDLYFGAGGEFHINDNLSLRSEWTRYLVEYANRNTELDSFSGSVVWNF